jgi:hypothetical protein
VKEAKAPGMKTAFWTKGFGTESGPIKVRVPSSYWIDPICSYRVSEIQALAGIIDLKFIVAS